jgi:hypothetical protein
MGNGMMNRMMGRAQQEIDSAEITNNGAVLGRLDVVRYSSIGNSLQTRLFTFALIRNSIFSFAIAVTSLFGLFTQRLPGLSVGCVLLAEAAVLFELQAVRIVLPVLHGIIITLFALAAGYGNTHSHLLFPPKMGLL